MKLHYVKIKNTGPHYKTEYPCVEFDRMWLDKTTCIRILSVDQLTHLMELAQYHWDNIDVDDKYEKRFNTYKKLSQI